MSGIDDVHRMAEEAKKSLAVGIAGAKHLGSTCLLAGGDLSEIIKALEKIHTGRLQEVAAYMIQAGSLEDATYKEGFDSAVHEVGVLTEGTENPHAIAALALTFAASEKYGAAAIEAANIGTDLEIVLGLLGSIGEQLTSMRERLCGVREELHSVAGAWDGPVGQVVAPLIGKETIPGAAPSAIEALDHYQADLGMNGHGHQ